MYGKYMFISDLSETFGEIANILGHIKGRPHTPQEILHLCRNYKQLALVCACAYLAAPIASGLRQGVSHPRVKTTLAGEVENFLLNASNPLRGPAMDESGHLRESLVVITEVAHCLLVDMVSLKPNLLSIVGMPNMYLFFPTEVQDIGPGRTMAYTINVTPRPTARLLT